MPEIKAGKYNCIAVLGPTASGKTRLACAIAYEFAGEIISADSRQVYRGLDMGTGKDLSSYFINGRRIPHHLIDVAEPGQQFYLHDFTRELQRSFEAIRERNRLPVICGGTGLYLDALRKQYAFTQVPEDQRLRQKLIHLDKTELIKQLESFPHALTAHVDRTSLKRLMRGIEVAAGLSKHTPIAGKPLPYRPLYLGIKPPLDTLHKRIAERLDDRLRNGMIEEAEGLMKRGVSSERLSALGLEYRFLAAYLGGTITRDALRDGLLTAIRQYARRQMTWFRKMEKEGVEILWFDTPDADKVMGRISAASEK